MRRFEFVEGTSSKFWEIEQDGSDLDIAWGRIGTAGQSQTKSFADAAKATAAMDKLIAEKTGKGYVETTGGAANPAKPATTATTAKATPATGAKAAPASAPAPAPAPAATPTKIAAAAPAPTLAAAPALAIAPTPPAATAPDLRPWESAGPTFAPDTKLFEKALPSRRFPAAPRNTPDAPSVWLQLGNATSDLGKPREAGSEPSLWPRLARAWERLRSVPAQFSPDEEAVVYALASAARPNIWQWSCPVDELVDVLVGALGLPATVDTLLKAHRIGIKLERGTTYKQREYVIVEPDQDHRVEHWIGHWGEGERTLREHLSRAEPAVYADCVERIRAALPTLHPSRQVAMAMLLQDEPHLSNETALALAGPNAPKSLKWLRLTATSPEAIAAIGKDDSSFLHETSMVATLIRERGMDALAALLPAAHADLAGEALLAFGTPEAVAALARAAPTSKAALLRMNTAAERWPLAAIVALAPLAAGTGKEAAIIGATLSRLLAAHLDAVPSLRPWLNASAQAVIDRMLQQLSGPVETAPVDALPAVLGAPPWLASKQKKKAGGAFGLAPLPIAAVEAWEPGFREEALAERDWHVKTRKACEADPKTMAHHIGIDWHHVDGMKINLDAGDAIAANDLDALLGCWQRWLQFSATRPWGSVQVHDRQIGWLPPALGVPYFNAVAGDSGYSYRADNILAKYGLRVLPGLQAVVRRYPGENLSLALNIGDASFAAPMARAFAKLKSQRDTGKRWLLKFPEHAACALIADALGKPGEARDNAGIALRLLLDQGHGDLLRDVARRYGMPEVSAALEAVFAEDPLDRFPAKRTALPTFWQPAAWRRPVLADGPAAGMPLPDAALDALGTMLAFPTTEGVYPGLEHVRAACTRDSLADFTWDLFGAWLSAGAPSKDNWAFNALGRYGNDETARRLTPYLRTWPGEGGHARAVAGLDVLAAIGTDVALMLLNGIAQKVKFKGLQDKAREKIDEIAQARGLTVEELEDRLAPDLGLDEHGTLELDFGPRKFRVGFDEALRPYVRDADGARLGDLPKPKKTDDAELSAAAVERFKQLKKDARTVASQQVLRLELAMCARRRWTPDVFRQLLVAHPLVRHLVQRIVWGVYELPPGDEGSFGGRLLAVFRVEADGGFTTATDDPFELPEGDAIHIGIPHALELPAADAAAFGQLFADYQLLQPFAQLGRETYALADIERGTERLERWNGRAVPTGRILGLVNKGWRRGQAQDAGGIWYFFKPLADGKVIELSFEPGIFVGAVDEYPEQKLLDVHYGTPSAWGDMQQGEAFAGLDAIAASEMIRDLEALAG